MGILKDLWKEFFYDTAKASSYHVGYYKDDNDIEAMAVLRYDELEIKDDYWGIYIFEDEGVDEKILREYQYFNDHGFEIIKVETEDLEFEEAVSLFYRWLEEKYLIEK